MSSQKRTELNDRITEIRTAKNLSKAQFSKALGISNTFVTDLESGRNKKISRPLARLISVLYGYNEDWILTGEGEMHAPTSGGRHVQDSQAMNNHGGEKSQSPAEIQPWRVSDALIMASRVLDSGTSYADALYVNIVHFDRAIQAVDRMTIMEICQHDQAEQLERITAELGHMRGEIERLTKENEHLKKDLPPGQK